MKPRHPNVELYKRQMAALPVTERCLFCTWEWEGTAGDGRERALAHRLKTHPEIKPARRKLAGHLQSFRQPKLKQIDLDEIYGERDKRARLLGIEIS